MAEGQDAAIKIGAKAEQSALCMSCKQMVAPGQYYTYKAKDGSDLALCGACRTQAESSFEAETKDLRMFGAVLFGVGAGAVGAAIWYFIVAAAGVSIGYMALGLGYLIGFAVRIGAGGKRGFPLQALSAGIALVSLFGAKYFIFLHFLREYLKEKYPTYDGHLFFVSPVDPAFLGSLVSPMGLLIWAFALYVAFSVPKARSL